MITLLMRRVFIFLDLWLSKIIEGLQKAVYVDYF